MAEAIQSAHMIAICGVGMAPLAVMLKERGVAVSGCDQAAFPPMSEVLAEAGVQVALGFSPEHLEPEPDLVVVGNAIPASNPEARWVEERGLRRWSFPETLSRLFLEGRRPLVVAGTHGKTTTTGMLARALQVAGLDPGYLVGGLVRDLGRFAQSGSGEFFVVEGDEYDSAYFDKRPKFLHYRPSAAIITSIEFDHADIYRSLEEVKQAFGAFVGLLPAGAPLVVCADDPVVQATVAKSRARLVTYGIGPGAVWRAAGIAAARSGMEFDVFYRGRPMGRRLRLGLSGRMNVSNSLAVYALCRELGVAEDAVVEALAEFRGAARRQEVIGEASGVVVVDDFAHHPSAVAATLAAMRARFDGRRLWAVFEPRSNTSRRAVFQRHYAESLAAADCVVVSAVYSKPNDPLRPEEMLSTTRLVEDLRAAGRHAWSADGPDEILARLPGELRRGDVVVCMSNGAFGNLPRRLLAALA